VKIECGNHSTEFSPAIHRIAQDRLARRLPGCATDMDGYGGASSWLKSDHPVAPLMQRPPPDEIDPEEAARAGAHLREIIEGWEAHTHLDHQVLCHLRVLADLFVSAGRRNRTVEITG
jgi:hypothetical protein